MSGPCSRLLRREGPGKTCRNLCSLEASSEPVCSSWGKADDGGQGPVTHSLGGLSLRVYLEILFRSTVANKDLHT